MDSASALTPETLLQHEAFVLRLARSLVRDDADARDVAQSALVSALAAPPRHDGLIPWLSRVVRNHAHDLRRGGARRSQREHAVARSERADAAGCALEHLETTHDVVRAVLALDEPYRGVVVATYYEGLGPGEIAARRGVPAGTVRSQLARAHERLRTKLDRAHGGERRTWMAALTGLIEVRGDAAPASAYGIGIAAAICAGAAVCAAIVFAMRGGPSPDGTRDEGARAVAAADVSTVAATRERPSPARSPVAPAEAETAPLEAEFALPDDLDGLLLLSRQIKSLVLGQRLAVTDAERARAGIPADSATAGVARLLARDTNADRYALPWMRDGGSSWSFTERAHDPEDGAQIWFERGSLMCAGVVLDLGVRRLADVPATSQAPAWTTRGEAFVWQLACMDFEPTRRFREIHAARLSEALELGEIDDAAVPEIDRLRVPFARAEAGHAYLVRSVHPTDFDLLVAVEVIAVEDDRCTIAYRVLDSRGSDLDGPTRGPRSAPASALAPPPEAVAKMSQPRLVETLGRVRARADELLFLEFAADIEKRFGAWRAEPQAGIVRLVPHSSPWPELASVRAGGSQFSFVARSHVAEACDVRLDDEAAGAVLSARITPASCGAVADLGTTAIESVTLDLVAASSELGLHLVETRVPECEPVDARDQDRTRLEAEAARNRAAARADFDERTRARGGASSVVLRRGATYAVRSVRFGSHDVLAAVHVADLDEYGAVLAWKILDGRVVDRR